MAVETYTVPSDRVVHETKVDFTRRNVEKALHVVQYDKSLPVIAVHLYKDGFTYTLPANADMKIRWGKRDHTFIYKSVLGCNTNRQIVYFDVDEQMTYFNGLCNPILELIVSGNKAGSSSIPFEIDRNPVQNSDIESHSEYPDLERAVERAEEAVERTEAAVEEAEEAVEKAVESEAWAVGEIDGEPVPQEAPQYHNNSKYYAEEAGDSATAASSSETNAATSASNAASSASAAAASASNAASSEENAEESASNAHESELNALDYFNHSKEVVMVNENPTDNTKVIIDTETYDEAEFPTMDEDFTPLKNKVDRIEEQIGRQQETSADLDEIITNVKLGLGKEYYKTGDKIVLPYIWEGTTYQCQHNIVDHGDVINENNETVHGLALEWHHTIPLGLAFDPDEIMMVVGVNGMPAGTYYFKVAGDSFTSQNGKYIQFTVTSNLVEGQCLKPSSSYNTQMAGAQMRVYADGKSFSALYSFEMSEGQNGIYLGTMYSTSDTGQASTYLELDTDHNVYINHYHRVFLGYNRYSQSLYRQFLNSDGLNWWVKQNIFDRAPSNIFTLEGFLTGYSSEFKSKLNKVKIVTYTNTVTDSGATDITYDKIFLHSMANINVDGFSSEQNINGLEGPNWEYYKNLAIGQDNLNPNGTFKAWSTYPILIKYALNAQTSPQYVFSRSAYRSYGYIILIVYTSGYVGNASGYAYYGYRCLPACILC